MNLPSLLYSTSAVLPPWSFALERPVISIRPGRAKNVCGPTTPSLSLMKESMVRTSFGCAGSGATSKTQILLSSSPPAQR